MSNTMKERMRHRVLAEVTLYIDAVISAKTMDEAADLFSQRIGCGNYDRTLNKKLASKEARDRQIIITHVQPLR